MPHRTNVLAAMAADCIPTGIPARIDVQKTGRCKMQRPVFISCDVRF
ncbi:hypothetical protein [Mesobacillus subterraneus]